MVQTQSTVVTTAHGATDGGRSQEVGVVDNLHGTTDSNGADIRGSQGDNRELMGSRDAAGTGSLGRAAVTSARDDIRAPEA